MAEQPRASGDTIRGPSVTEELHDDYREGECARLLYDALNARERADMAHRAERFALTRFFTVAKQEGWSWGRIGNALGVSGTAVRRYYERNKEDE